MSDILSLITYIGLVAVAVERAVEFIKPIISKIPAIGASTWTTQVVAGLMGAGSYFLHAPSSSLLTSLGAPLASALLGLSVSGGSGLWHDLSSALQSVISPAAAPVVATTAATTTVISTPAVVTTTAA